MERLRRQRALHLAPGDVLARLLGPPVLALLAAPHTGSILWFIGAPPDELARGLAGASFRLALVACGAGLLAAHGNVLRGPDRAVLDPHPADPCPLVTMLLARQLRATGSLALALALLLTPLLSAGHHGAFALGAAVVLGGWLSGAGLGFLSALAGVEAARSHRLRGVLEAIRGGTPRMQAALIYAPGLAIAAGGGAIHLATMGLQASLGGAHALGLALLAAPFLVALLAWSPVPSLASSTWYRASRVLAEVDADWARVAPQEETRHVYLEWIARFAPGLLRPHLLRSLRQGWRVFRPWILGAWGLGLLAALAGWTVAPDAHQRALMVAAPSLCALAGVAIRMEITDPRWLGETLCLPSLPRLAGRWLAVLAWLQGLIIPGFLALLVRGGQALSFLLVVELAAAAAALLATASSPLRSRGWLTYVPFAMLLWLTATRSLS